MHTTGMWEILSWLLYTFWCTCICTTGTVDLLLIMSIHTVEFQFTGYSFGLSDNILHDWLFPHHWQIDCSSFVNTPTLMRITYSKPHTLSLTFKKYIISVQVTYNLQLSYKSILSIIKLWKPLILYFSK